MNTLRKWLLLVIALAFASPACATFTVNNSKNSNGGSTSQAVTITIASGHSVFCIWYFDTFGNGGSVSGVTDSAADTFTLGLHPVNDGGNKNIGSAFFGPLGSGITTVTVQTTGSTGGFVGLWVWDISATGAISFVADGGQNIQPSVITTDGTSTGTLAITSSDGLLLAAAVDESSNAVATGTGFTADATGQNSSPSEHKAVSSSAAGTFTASTAGDRILTMGGALQISGAVVTNGVLISNGHPVSSAGGIVYQ